MLDGLVFLPVADVPAGMKFLRAQVPDLGGDQQKLTDLINYFDATYVSRSLHAVKRQTSRPTLRLRRNPPLFPVDKWNVFDATLTTGIRTNNECESWNNGFQHLVGHAHPSVWTVIESMQMDQAMASTAMLLHARGQPPAKRVCRAAERNQERLRTLCCRRRDGDITLEDMLRGIGHTVRFM